MRIACLQKTWAICLIDHSLNLFSIRLFKYNVYGGRTRFMPYTTLKIARPRTKSKALRFLQVPPWLLYVQIKSKFEISVQPNQSVQLRFWPLYTFWRSLSWPYLVLSDFLGDLIWMSETLFHSMITLLFMIQSYFLSCACHASSHDLIILPVMYDLIILPVMYDLIILSVMCFFP